MRRVRKPVSVAVSGGNRSDLILEPTGRGLALSRALVDEGITELEVPAGTLAIYLLTVVAIAS